MQNTGKIKLLAKVILAISILVSSCVEFELVSPVPEISLIDFGVTEGYDTLLQQAVKVGLLEFSFIDGDADFGVYWDVANDNSFPDSVRYNLFINLYEKINGAYRIKYFTQWISDSNRFDTLSLNQYIYYNEKLDRVGQNKTVKGIIRSSIQMVSTEDLKDSLRLEFYIRDRALNKSNIEYTNDFLIE
jgi:hypothetical protein